LFDFDTEHSYWWRICYLLFFCLHFRIQVCIPSSNLVYTH